MAQEITSSEDIIDSRDVIERIEELTVPTDELTADEAHELVALTDLAEQGQEFDDWEYGVALVRDSYFVRYAQELADEINDVGGDAGIKWPFTCIDWEQAARELQHDYTPVTFDGVTYWTR